MEYSGQYSLAAIGLPSELNEVVGPDALRLDYLSGSIDLLPRNDRPGKDSRLLREFD